MRGVARVLRERFPKGARAVEVGCGKGDFLRLLREGGWFRVKGYDAAAEGGDPDIEARFLGPADRIEADLVILRHVLEHIRKPHEFLALLREIFSGAPVFIEVPEFGWIERNSAFFDLTYEHVNCFSPVALGALFAGGA